MTAGVSPLCSNCQNGTILLVRTVSQQNCPNYSSYSVSNCSFPCLPVSSQTTDAISDVLNLTYLQQLFTTLEVSSYYSSFSVFEIEQNTIGILFSPCDSLNMSYLNSIVSELVHSVFPGFFALIFLRVLII